MEAVKLTRSFLKKPLYSVYLLLGVVLLVEGIGWTATYHAKIDRVNTYGGFIPYLGILLRGFFIPEIFTTYILIILINRYHDYFKIDTVPCTLRGVSRYEALLLPVILLSFIVFNPVTESVRFLLEAFPDYSFSNYWRSYITGTFTWNVYLRYVAPILLIGYIPINISLISDYFTQRQQEQEEAKQLAVLEPPLLPASPPSSPYLMHIKGRDAQGELDFPTSDVFYFTVEDRACYAVVPKGRYVVSKALTELENELDPTQFFRVKRDYIVNRKAVLNYAYWENGKYIVRLNTHDHYEIVVPRARMQEFREWLQADQRDQRSFADSDQDPLLMTHQPL
ncbi:LytTR family DNA-binding domain-containing protein [Spirosoma sp. KUDC1026]|uniref:LytTR family DNA-binding domain-containing protein n=1 Tax=Spirosoma sp. KUDC1026 TaxID=2745947 RepID=UPI00159BC2A9|nr:LytTR family DNA-binding domain-containing protein [Spirosoma sp. KUDC1026]QKZ12029.1 LytTR family transcriptional regulator [Spirosoma sp. KUDC1026]